MATFYKKDPHAKDLASFTELNRYSKGLRQAALEMMDFFVGLGDKTKEVHSVIVTLKRMNTGDIQEFDELLQSLNNNLLKVNLKMNEHPKLGQNFNTQNVQDYFLLANALTNEATKLAQQAVKISEK